MCPHFLIHTHHSCVLVLALFHSLLDPSTGIRALAHHLHPASSPSAQKFPVCCPDFVPTRFSRISAHFSLVSVPNLTGELPSPLCTLYGPSLKIRRDFRATFFGLPYASFFHGVVFWLKKTRAFSVWATYFHSWEHHLACGNILLRGISVSTTPSVILVSWGVVVRRYT